MVERRIAMTDALARLLNLLPLYFLIPENRKNRPLVSL